MVSKQTKEGLYVAFLIVAITSMTFAIGGTIIRAFSKSEQATKRNDQTPCNCGCKGGNERA